GVCAIGGLAIVAAARNKVFTNYVRHHPGQLVKHFALAGDVGPNVVRYPLLAIHGALALGMVAYLWTYLGGAIHLGPITAAHPQKVFRSIVAVGGLAFAIHAFFGHWVPRARVIRAVAWFLVGLSPALLNIARGQMPGAAIVNHRLAEIPALASQLVHDALPI